MCLFNWLDTKLIGCTRLRAVSGILRTQRGRRGSGLGRLRAGTAYAGLAMRSRSRPPSTTLQLPRLHPCGFASRPCGSTLRRVACLSPLWLNSSRRRAVPTSHWPWVSSRAARRRTATGWIADTGPTVPCTLSHLAGVGQCPLAIGHGCLVGLLVGVPPRVGSPTAPCTLRVWRQWCRPLLVRVQLGRHRVTDRHCRAASPVSGILD